MRFSLDIRVLCRLLLTLIAAIVLAGATLFGSSVNGLHPPAPGQQATGAAQMPDFGKLALSFEPNAGQTDPAARFVAHAPVGVLYFTASSVVVSLKQSQASPSGHTFAPAVLRESYLGASPAVDVRGSGMLPGKVNYYLGNDPDLWHTNLPTYQSISYSALYPGVDLAYSGNGMQLESTYTLSPGADPSQIRWRYDRAAQLTVDAAGNLQIALDPALSSSGPALAQSAPVAWQEVNGAHVPVDARYVVTPDNTVGFALGNYDPTRPLIIDPTLLYSTYLGGTGDDFATSVGVDLSNRAYVTGYTQSLDFPTTNAVQPFYAGGSSDVFLARLNPAGTALDFATYLGGSGEDIAYAVHLGAGDILLVAGETRSTDFPVRAAYQTTLQGASDAFVTVFDRSGTGLAYSSYFGGSGEDTAYGVSEYDESYAFITGSTTSTDMPLGGAYQPQYGGGPTDGFLTVLSLFDPSIAYSTYFGGNGEDAVYDVSVSGRGEAYITGATFSTDFPLLNPLQPGYGGSGDAFVAGILSTGFPEFSSYMGGSNFDEGRGTAGEGSAFIYVGGVTASSDFPLANPVQPAYGGGPSDAFVAHIASDGDSLIFSTFLGGSGADAAMGVDEKTTISGDVILGGWTESTDFPVADPVQAQNGGDRDLFVSILPGTGQPLSLSSYLGGTGHDTGVGVAINYQSDTLYLAGYTQADDFPVTGGVVQPVRMGGTDAVVARVSLAVVTPTPTPTGTPPTPTGTRTPRLTFTPAPSFTPDCAHAWSLLTPVPTASTFDNVFQSVAALSATDAWAVGYAYYGGGIQRALTAHWDGVQWSLVPSPDVGLNDTKLFDVAAVSPQDIWAVGYYSAGQDLLSLVEHWDGTQWNIVPSPSPHSNIDELTSIAVVAPNDIWAVGYSYAGTTVSFTLVEHWDGTQWSVVSSPSPGSAANSLDSVSVVSANDIWAVGSYADFSSPYQTLTMHWDGTQWSVVPSVGGGTANSNHLTGVSAISANDVWAVGAYGGLTLTEHWDGSAWNLIGAPNPGLNSNDLNDVVTLSSNDVWAVGSYNTSTIQTLAEHWNGSTWAQVSSPNVAGSQNDTLLSVAADPSGELFAVGYLDLPSGSIFYPLAELYSGIGAPCATMTPSTATPSITPTNTPTRTSTNTPTAPLSTSTAIPSHTNTPTAIGTASPPATATRTPSVVQPTSTSTETVLATATPDLTSTPTPTACTLDFTDVPPDSTFYPYVHCLACLGIISGYADGTFRPGNNVSRGQLSKIVSNSAGFNDPPGTQLFEDVLLGSTFYDYIGRLAGRGYISGYPCGGDGEPCGPASLPYFRPSNSATRGQISKIVSNAAGFAEPPGTQLFEDVPPGSTFYDYIQRLASRAVISGYPCGGLGEPCGPTSLPYFRPSTSATRGQTSKIDANTFFPDCAP